MKKYTLTELLDMDDKAFKILKDRFFDANYILTVQNEHFGKPRFVRWTKYDTKDCLKTGIIAGSIVLGAYLVSKNLTPKYDKDAQ